MRASGRVDHKQSPAVSVDVAVAVVAIANLLDDLRRFAQARVLPLLAGLVGGLRIERTKVRRQPLAVGRPAEVAQRSGRQFGEPPGLSAVGRQDEQIDAPRRMAASEGQAVAVRRPAQGAVLAPLRHLPQSARRQRADVAVAVDGPASPPAFPAVQFIVHGRQPEVRHVIVARPDLLDDKRDMAAVRGDLRIRDKAELQQIFRRDRLRDARRRRSGTIELRGWLRITM